MRRMHCFVLLAWFCSSCSSINSVEDPAHGKAGDKDGLTYFMPKKDFLITVTVKDKKVSKVLIGTTASYPDLSTQYVLRHGTNLFGKNTLDVGVTESGLLTSTKSTTQSNVADAFKNLATSAGTLKVFGFDQAAEIPSTCEVDGEHTFIYEQSGDDLPLACGMKVEIKRIVSNDSVTPHSKDKGQEYSGVFYRQSLAYRITATGNGVNSAAIVLSPSESKTYFLPVSKTFFANNEADFTFVDGVPQKYKQDTDGEFVALFKLPADVLGAYFSAIGNTFDAFKTNDSKQTAALTESLKLELAKKKYDACIAAIKANDDARIKDLNCQQ